MKLITLHRASVRMQRNASYGTSLTLITFLTLLQPAGDAAKTIYLTDTHARFTQIISSRYNLLGILILIPRIEIIIVTINTFE